MAIVVTLLIIVLVGGGVIVTRVGLFKVFAEIWNDAWKKGPRA